MKVGYYFYFFYILTDQNIFKNFKKSDWMIKIFVRNKKSKIK